MFPRGVRSKVEYSLMRYESHSVWGFCVQGTSQGFCWTADRCRYLERIVLLCKQGSSQRAVNLLEFIMCCRHREPLGGSRCRQATVCFRVRSEIESEIRFPAPWRMQLRIVGGEEEVGAAARQKQSRSSRRFACQELQR